MIPSQLLERVRENALVVAFQRVFKGFLDDQCLVRASALTYTTLLAVVPLLAVILAILKGAGFADRLRPFLLERFPVIPVEVIEQVLEYINRANVQAVGGIGIVALGVSCWTMLSNIEGALNHVFAVRSSRGLMRRAGEYLSMLVVGAMVVVLSIVLQTVLGSPALFERFVGAGVASDATRLVLGLLPWISVWAGFTFLYSWMPNERVDIRTALTGGLVGGTLFQLVQLAYIDLQLGFGRYHAIYGALAQLPILLVWIYLSWAVVLFGAEVALARQTFGVRADLSSDGVRAKARIGWTALQVVGEAFQRGGRTPGPQELAARLGVSIRELREALEPLLDAEILVEPEDGHGYLPAGSLASLSLERVLLTLERDSG